MHIRSLRTALFASSALVFAASASALAQEQDCTQRLDRIEQQLAQAQLDQQRQDDIQEVIRGARALADTGDQEGCMQVVAELEDLTQLLDEQSAQTGQQGQGQKAQQQQVRQDQQQAQQGQPQAQQEQPQATSESPLAAMPASDVIGTEVQNAEGDTVAEIVDLVKEQGAENLYAVLSVGGFLGIGDKKVVVPLEELDVGQEGEIVMANVTEDQLRNMPEYNEEGYESTAGLEEQPADAAATAATTVSDPVSAPAKR